jgi:hypothetical protein
MTTQNMWRLKWTRMNSRFQSDVISYVAWKLWNSGDNATGRAWIGDWVAHTSLQARCRTKYHWHPALLMWDRHSATCNMVQVRNTAGGVRDSGEFKLLVGIVNKTWPLVPFIGTLAVICLTAFARRIFWHTSGMWRAMGTMQCIRELWGYFHNTTCAAVESPEANLKLVFSTFFSIVGLTIIAQSGWTTQESWLDLCYGQGLFVGASRSAVAPTGPAQSALH